jgi:CubicO group peptidase (beta-lactamase class C family)
VVIEVDARAAGFEAKKLARIGEHLSERYVEPGKISGCQVLVSRHGIPAYFESYGLMDRERNKPMQDDTLFRIYSMSKPITSVALMMLWEEGRFQLSDPVHRYIPSWRNQSVWQEGEGSSMVTRRPKTPPTMQHILSHTAGLTYGGLLPGLESPVDAVYQQLGVARGDGETLMDFAEKLGRVPLMYEPGSKWCYSLATDVCGALVEIISGQPFEQFLQERLFAPLGMRDTGFRVSDEQLHRFAACYVRGPDKRLLLEDDPETSHYRHKRNFFSGGGGLVGTTADYMAFCEMLRQGGCYQGTQILGRRTLELMTANHLLQGQSLAQMAVGAFSETTNAGVGFGLGFASTLDEVASCTVGAGDFYWGGRASTLFWVDPEEDLQVIFMTQLIPSSTFNFRGQLKNIIYGALK